MICWHCKRDVEATEVPRGRYYSLIHPACPACAAACRAGLEEDDKWKDAIRRGREQVAETEEATDC